MYGTRSWRRQELERRPFGQQEPEQPELPRLGRQPRGPAQSEQRAASRQR